jgi:hypothetical protein
MRRISTYGKRQGKGRFFEPASRAKKTRVQMVHERSEQER